MEDPKDRKTIFGTAGYMAPEIDRNLAESEAGMYPFYAEKKMKPRVQSLGLIYLLRSTCSTGIMIVKLICTARCLLAKTFATMLTIQLLLTSVLT